VSPFGVDSKTGTLVPFPLLSSRWLKTAPCWRNTRNVEVDFAVREGLKVHGLAEVCRSARAQVDTESQIAYAITYVGEEWT